jgi:hypothetical protein
MTTKKNKTRITYQARLFGRGGELDMISDENLEDLARRLGKQLIKGDWPLSVGDEIRITEREIFS